MNKIFNIFSINEFMIFFSLNIAFYCPLIYNSCKVILKAVDKKVNRLIQYSFHIVWNLIVLKMH